MLAYKHKTTVKATIKSAASVPAWNWLEPIQQASDQFC